MKLKVNQLVECMYIRCSQSIVGAEVYVRFIRKCKVVHVIQKIPKSYLFKMIIEHIEI